MNFRVIDKADTKHTLIIPLTTKDLASNLENLTAQFGFPSAVAHDFKASNEETLLIYSSQAGLSEKILLLGLGDNFKTETLRNAIRLVFHKQKEKFGEEVIINLDYLIEKTEEQEIVTAIEACTNGAELATYQIAKFKQEEKPAKFPQNISFVFLLSFTLLFKKQFKREQFSPLPSKKYLIW